MKQMTPRERAITAIQLRQPDSVPTFELEFQLVEELMGRRPSTHQERAAATAAERDALMRSDVELWVEVYDRLEYSIAYAHSLGSPEAVRLFKQLTDDKYLVWAHADGTFSIPSGEEMMEFTYWLADRPDDAKTEAKRRVEAAVEGAKVWFDAGVEVFGLCSDYCFNAGPFLSPAMFAEFVTPYLADNISLLKDMGAYVFKHTDGDLMPILQQIVSCEPHALHSLDPMAGVDIAEVKRLVGDKVALFGNVNCALLQTGTRDEIIASAEYALKHGKPGGGYIFCTSNVAFKGMPLENYLLILDVWKKHRQY